MEPRSSKTRLDLTQICSDFWSQRHCRTTKKSSLQTGDMSNQVAQKYTALCHTQTETSLSVLSVGTICFSAFYEMTFKFWLWPPLTVKGSKEAKKNPYSCLKRLRNAESSKRSTSSPTGGISYLLLSSCGSRKSLTYIIKFGISFSYPIPMFSHTKDRWSFRLQ